MTLVVGHIYVYPCHWIVPPHDKIGLCLCAERRWFFWFNSKPARHGQGQLAIADGEHAAITKDCHLDLGSVLAASPEEATAAADRGVLSAGLRARIVEALSSPIKVLPEAQRAFALAALT